MAEDWLKKSSSFNLKSKSWENIYNELSENDKLICKQQASQAIDFLNKRYAPEDFSYQTLLVIYASLNKNNDKAIFSNELDGSKYKIYFDRHYELYNFK